MINNNINSLGLSRSVVLVGLMGAGKSTIGKRLATELGLEFIDSDNEIADAAECTISDIFEIYGEPIFRDLEKRVILRLLNNEEPIVLATGGGAFMNEEIREVIAEKSVSIWLKADVEILLERVSRKNKRPLLEKGDKRVILNKLMKERDPFYSLANFIVNSGAKTHEAVISEIINILKAKNYEISQS